MRHYRFLFIIVMMTLCNNITLADEASINMHYKGNHGAHNNLPAPVDAPDVYYNSTTQQIIIDATGFVNYYDVEIVLAASWVTVISTQVNGSYDTIDISSLPTGEYYITIDSPTGNTYEGFFDTY